MARPPKPTKLLEYEKGKLYSDQRDRKEYEPTAETEIKPRCPKRFSPEERAAWREVAAILKNYGLFTVANALQLELLSTAWAQYVDASKKLAETKSIIIKGKDGTPAYNPYFNAQHKLGQLVDKYSQNLGLGSLVMAKMGCLMLRKKKEKDEFFD